MARIELGQYRQAIEDLDQAARLDPQHPFAESDRKVASELAGATAPYNAGAVGSCKAKTKRHSPPAPLTAGLNCWAGPVASIPHPPPSSLTV